MTGAILQLVAKGIQDIFISSDPQITFFKIVYRRHTNFSIEPIPQYFTHKPNFGKKSSCTLSPNGDLIGKTYLVATLPKIKPFFLDDGTIDTYTKFAWVRKIGFALIKTIEIEIGGQILDKQYGEWLNIIYELFNPKNNRAMDIMIGNVEQLYSYTSTKDEYILYIPLQFWFCNHTSKALPILCLHHSEVKINIELNELENCCLITPTNYLEIEDNVVGFKFGDIIEQTIEGQTATGLFTHYDALNKRLYYSKISRNKFKSLSTDDYDSNINTMEFIKYHGEYLIKNKNGKNFCIPKMDSKPKICNNIKLENINIQKCHLLVNYIFLDIEERNRYIQNKHEYLIEQVQVMNPQIINSSYFSAMADSINPSIFMTWYAQLLYLQDRNNNDMFNFTNNIDNKSLISESSITFNGYDRISIRDCNFFNHQQPLNHFKNGPSNGLQTYSFSLNPNNLQPSGSCNMSYIGQTEIKMKMDNIVNEQNKALFKGYYLSMNVLRIIDGLVGLVFV